MQDTDTFVHFDVSLPAFTISPFFKLAPQVVIAEPDSCEKFFKNMD